MPAGQVSKPVEINDNTRDVADTNDSVLSTVELSGPLSQPNADLSDTPTLLIQEPHDGQIHVVRLQPGQSYAFDFSRDDIEASAVNADSLVLYFGVDGTLVLENARGFNGDITDGILTLANGEIISFDTFGAGFGLVPVEILSMTGSTFSAPQDLTPQAQTVLPTFDLSQLVAQNIQDGGQFAFNIDPNQLASIETAAGPQGGLAGVGGFGFQSQFSPSAIVNIFAIGPINPTQLQFGNPDGPEDNPILLDDDVIVVVLNALPISNLNNGATFEDTQANVQFTITPSDFATDAAVTTLTLNNIPAGVIVDANGGQFDPATRTWTFTFTGDETITAGPLLTPAADSDIDLTGMNLLVEELDGGVLRTTTVPVDVIVDAVADTPDLFTADTNGQENTEIPLTINSNLNDLDGSETLTITIAGLPAGATLNNGVNNGDGSFTLNQADLNGLTLTPPNNFNGNIQLTVTATATETPTDNEITLANNIANNEQILNINVQNQADEAAITVQDAQTFEDNAANVPLVVNIQNGDGDETLTVTLSNIPNNVTVNAPGFIDNGNGTFTFQGQPGENLNTIITLTPPQNSDVDINDVLISTEVFDPDTNTTANNDVNIDVIVDAVADNPNLTANDVAGNEDTTIPLDLTSTLNDLDGSEALTIQIRNVPLGFTLSDGVQNGTTWTIDPADLPNLTITPPANFSGTLNLTIDATATETPTDTEFNFNNNVATVSEDFTVTFNAVPDAPLLTFNGTNANGDAEVLEDDSTLVPIQAELVDPAPDEVLSITVTGIPNNWNVDANGGQFDAATGTWTITLPAGVTTFDGGPILSPPAEDDTDLPDLQVTATATVNGQDADTQGTVGVIVDAVADTPNLDVRNTSGLENETIALDITSSLNDLDGSEALTFRIAGLPNGATLNNGVDNGDGSFTLQPADLNGLELTPPQNFTGSFNLNVIAIATETPTDTEFNLNNNVAQNTETIQVNIFDDQIPAIIDVNDAEVLEDNSVVVPLSVTPQGGDGNEIITVTLSNIPADFGVIAQDFVNNGDGTFTFTGQPGDDLVTQITLTPPPNSDVDGLDITITTDIFDPDTNVTTTTVETFDVIVDAVADTPDLTVQNAQGNENTDIPLDITSALNDLDGSETLTIILSGLPNGATLNNGIDNGDGTFTLDEADLIGLTLTPPQNFNGDISLNVTATANETPVDGETNLANNVAELTLPLTVTVNSVVQGPDVALVNAVNGNVQVLEDGSVELTIEAALVNPAANEQLTVTVENIDPAWNVNPAGGQFDAVTGTWTITLPVGVTTFVGGPILSPPANDDIDLNGLVITAIADDGVNQEDNSITGNVIVDAVADTPNLQSNSPGGLSGTSIPVNIITSLNDVDGSEIFAEGVVTIAGVPENVTLSAGIETGQAGVFEVPVGDLAGLTMDVPFGVSGQVNLVITVTAQEQVTDIDFNQNNNEASITQELNFIIALDDTPILDPDTANVDETNMVENTQDNVVTGNVNPDFGVDAPGTVEGNGTFAAGGSLFHNALSSACSLVTVAFDAGTDTYTGTAEDGRLIFTMIVNDDGSFTFTQFDRLDHGDATDANDIITLDFGVVGIDAQGDQTNSTVRINVLDDAPVLANDAHNYNPDQDIVMGNVLKGQNDTDGNGDDILSSDQGNFVTHVFFNNQFFEIPNDQAVAVNGQFGTLIMDSQGVYEYFIFNGVDPLTAQATDTFGYVVQDFDGDSSTVATLELTADLTGTTARFTGTTGQDQILGDNLDNLVDGRQGNDIVNGGGGNDAILGGRGSDILTGGTGADTFTFLQFDNADGSIDTINDFSGFNGENDVIDISDMLRQFNNDTDDINNFVSINDNGQNTTIAVDQTGQGNFTNVVTVDGLSGQSLQQLVQNGDLITG